MKDFITFKKQQEGYLYVLQYDVVKEKIVVFNKSKIN